MSGNGLVETNQYNKSAQQNEVPKIDPYFVSTLFFTVLLSFRCNYIILVSNVSSIFFVRSFSQQHYDYNVVRFVKRSYKKTSIFVQQKNKMHADG